MSLEKDTLPVVRQTVVRQTEVEVQWVFEGAMDERPELKPKVRFQVIST